MDTSAAKIGIYISVDDAFSEHYQHAVFVWSRRSTRNCTCTAYATVRREQKSQCTCALAKRTRATPAKAVTHCRTCEPHNPQPGRETGEPNRTSWPFLCDIGSSGTSGRKATW